MPTGIMRHAQRSPRRNGAMISAMVRTNKANQPLAPEDKTANIVPAPTHAEIASRTSTHREAVTRELNRLAKLGIIEQRNRMLFVKDVSRLRALVHPIGE